MHLNTKIVVLIFLFTVPLAVGCDQQGAAPVADNGDIEAFIEENPDAVVDDESEAEMQAEVDADDF